MGWSLLRRQVEEEDSGREKKKSHKKERGRKRERGKAEIEEWFLMPMVWSLYEDIFSKGRQHHTPLSYRLSMCVPCCLARH